MKYLHVEIIDVKKLLLSPGYIYVHFFQSFNSLFNSRDHIV